MKNPLPEDFQRELRAHGICPWTVRKVQVLNDVTPLELEKMRMMAEEGRTRGAEILEVVFRGRKISEQDEAVYVVSVIESREIENVVLAFLRRQLNSTESLPP